MLPVYNDLDISKRLVSWYEENKRDLPWRTVADPYRIWVSEIILQQTRVGQGMDYYLRFIERFPDVNTLARASEDEVLKYWQGLGYYSRARNMHAAAKIIATRYNGGFPRSYADVLALPGIGEYTAAAIVSFAWNQPYPVVDGNVFRVLSRLFAEEEPIDTLKGKKLFTALAGELLDRERPGLHNQAIMEFGALHCTPASPQCLFCPLRERCAAVATGNPLRYPVKRPAAKTRNRYLHYFRIVYNNKYWYLNRRSADDIWKGLFEFPSIETDGPADFAALQETKAFRQLFEGIPDLSVSPELVGKKHVLSHQTLYADFYRVDIRTEGNGLQYYLKIPEEEIGKYAVPRLIHIYLEKVAGNLLK